MSNICVSASFNNFEIEVRVAWYLCFTRADSLSLPCREFDSLVRVQRHFYHRTLELAADNTFTRSWVLITWHVTPLILEFDVFFIILGLATEDNIICICVVIPSKYVPASRTLLAKATRWDTRSTNAKRY